MKHQIIKNVFSTYAVNFLQMVLGFLVVPFLIHKLGKEAFGITALAETTILFFEIVTINIRIALSRYVTYSLGEGNESRFMEYLSSARYMLFISSGIVLVFGSILSYYFAQIFHVPDILINESRLLFFCVVISLVITAPNIVYWAILYAKQRFDLINAASSTGLILRGILIFLLFSILPKRYANLITYGVIYIFIKVAENFLVYVWQKRVMPGIKPRMAFFRISRVKEILVFSWHYSISQVSSMLYDNTASILINWFWGPEANAVYSIALKFPATMKNLFMRATWALAPTFTDLFAKNDKAREKRLFYMYAKIIAIITIPISITLIYLSKPLIIFWVGEDFLQSARLLSIQMVPLLMILPLSVSGCITNAYAKVALPSKVSLVLGIFNVVLAIFFIKVFNWGLASFAIAAAIALTCRSVIFEPFYACHLMGVSYRGYIYSTLIKPFLLGVSSISIAIYVIFLLQGKLSLSFISLVVLGMGFIVNHFLSYVFVLDDQEKIFVKELIISKLFNYRGTAKHVVTT